MLKNNGDKMAEIYLKNCPAESSLKNYSHEGYGKEEN